MIYIDFRFVCDQCSALVTDDAVLDAFERPPACLLPPGWQYRNRDLLCPECAAEPSPYAAA
jgi:hypothetical protein